MWNEEFQNLTHNIISEFLEATVSYELESPTVSLEDVFFPSVVLCNMNILRQSFIMTLMKDPDLKSRTTYEELFSLVDKHFIQGIKGNLTEKEELIKKSNIFFLWSELVQIGQFLFTKIFLQLLLINYKIFSILSGNLIYKKYQISI